MKKIEPSYATAALPRPHRAEGGFSLVEMIVGLAVMTEVILVILLLFDVNSELSRVQTQVADMQQSQRIAQFEISRMIAVAGRGGLDSARAIAVRTQVPDPTNVGDNDSPVVRPDTDVLTVRGVYRSPIFLVDYQNAGTLLYQEHDSSIGQFEGRITVNAQAITNIEQPLDLFTRMIADGQTGDALVMVSAVTDEIWAVTRIVGLSGDENQVTITFSFDPSDDRTAAYLGLSCCGGGFPFDSDQPIAFIGVLEEYRYYIREEPAVAADPNSEVLPRLSRAQYYPNTNEPFLGDRNNERVDVADNLVDLQLALAIDANDNGTIQEADDDDPNEWLYDVADESRVDQLLGGEPFNMLTGRVHWARVSTVARTQSPDPQYAAPRIEAIEDHAYDETEIPSTEDNRLERLHRRRLLRTTVDLRNQ